MTVEYNKNNKNLKSKLIIILNAFNRDSDSEQTSL